MYLPEPIMPSAECVRDADVTSVRSQAPRDAPFRRLHETSRRRHVGVTPGRHPSKHQVPSIDTETAFLDRAVALNPKG